MDKKWFVLIAMCLLTVMLNIDVTALNIAIPVMANEFYATLSEMQWVINAYVLLSAMLQILGGRLGDSYGHRKIFLIGTVLFVLSSAGAGLSLSPGMLIAFRVLQGVALGIAYPMTIVLTFESFPKNQQGFALSFIVGAMGVSLALGPPLGGLFVEYIGWRWIFYINVPIGILAYFLASAYCPLQKIEWKKKIDYKGAFLLLPALFGITCSLNQVQDWGFSSPAFLVLFMGGLAFLFFLYRLERKNRNPIVDFKLFTVRNFLFNNLIRLVVQLIFIPVLFFIPLYLQNIGSYSAVSSGLMMMALTLVIAIFSPIAGQWVDRSGDKIPNIVSMALFFIASLLFTFLEPEPNFYLLTSALVLVGVAVGVTFVSTTTGALAAVSSEKQGAATGVSFTIAFLGCALGLAISGAVIALVSRSALVEPLANRTLSSSELETIRRASQGIYPISNLLDPTFVSAARSSFIEGFHGTAYLWVALSLAALLLACFLNRPKAYERAHLDPSSPL